MRQVMWIVVSVLVLWAVGFGLWIYSLPPPTAINAPPVAATEVASMLASLQPPKRARPLIAIIGINDATETTDYLMPYGMLRRANVADVVMLATRPGAVKLYPALTVEPQATVAEFDEGHPQGADYVIVPAMSRDNDPVVMQWLKEQTAKGAFIMGVCAGAKVVAAAGLLDGKRATTHWFYRQQLRDKHPSLLYVADRRIVVDRGVATTTGISASMPMSLTLIEAIAGRAKAEEVARGLGLEYWDARHDSNAFKLTRPFVMTVLGNVLAFWKRAQIDIAVSPGMDEVSLALVADAWSRTYRSRALTFADTPAAVMTRNGVRIIPDHTGKVLPALQSINRAVNQPPAKALDHTLAAITERYGKRTADVVAMQLEYPQLGSGGKR